MPQLVANQPPPIDYYANILRTLVGHVVDEYGTMLSSSELKITRRFFQLSPFVFLDDLWKSFTEIVDETVDTDAILFH